MGGGGGLESGGGVGRGGGEGGGGVSGGGGGRGGGEGGRGKKKYSCKKWARVKMEAEMLIIFAKIADWQRLRQLQRRSQLMEVIPRLSKIWLQTRFR